ncbi:hypothetical protein Pcinc_023215 [Petrolisthes cinctipes]|uniref:Uncharacterized protein n=1 Tax=Petrolisthes cinctipes TaxID=88211 RepID=A0AAE1KFL4_PETCI|nr:hypothetical protein Pcinc_023215 [Petrolisthes cinctipes]
MDSEIQSRLSKIREQFITPVSQEAKKRRTTSRKRSSLFSSLFKRKRNHGDVQQKQAEDMQTEEPLQKRQCVAKLAPDPGAMLQQILKETQKHNQTVEKHNATLLHIYSDLVNAINEKNALLKEALDQK